VPDRWRNRLHTNVAMGLIALTFVTLAVNELYGVLSGL
jgi:hypothetical protein